VRGTNVLAGRERRKRGEAPCADAVRGGVGSMVLGVGFSGD
jgi:hypothetical protein